ncbi:MAG: T9SS type A sorting domain-containing protein [Bacteroidota bacterium]
MKKFLLFLVLTALLSSMGFAQLSGTKTIPGNYATLALAIADLNAQGVGAGGVTFNIAASYTETFTTATAGRITTVTGSVSSPVIFQKSGSGANPLITAATGTGALDAIFSIAGCDYVTFDGMSIQENAANVTTTTQMEWGFAILKASTLDGSQNITVKNCTITLNKTNTATIGIYSNNHLVTATTQLTPIEAPAGTNSNLKIYSNIISNCYNGISLSGYNHTFAPYDLFDQNNEVGKDGGNTITNFGGSSVAMNGIYTIYQNNLKIANNSITGAVSGTAQCAGIQLGSSTNGSLDLYGNTVSLQYTGTTSTFYGIYDNMGSTATNTNVINIYNNSVTGCTMPSATTGSCNYVYITHSGPNFTFHHNTINNNTYGSATASGTGSVYYMYQFGNPTTKGTVDVYANAINNNVRAQSSLAAGSTYFYYLGVSGNTHNTHDNVAINNTTATSGGAYVFYLGNGSITKNFYNNTVDGIINANFTLMGFYMGSGTNLFAYNNTIKNLTSNAATSVVSGMVFNSLGVTGNMIIYNNFVSELYAPNATNSASAVIGMNLNGQSVSTMGVYNNTIYLDAVSTGANFSTSGFLATTTPIYNDFRNNIVINKSTPNGTGITSALRYSASGQTNYSISSNNNNYYAGTPSANRLIYYDGANSDQTLTAFKLRVYPRDILSITENTTFVNTATTPYNLHVNGTVPSQVESGGTVVSTPLAVNTDFDGDARYPNSGFPVNVSFPAVAPDMGADEFGGIPNDITGPFITYLPLGFTASTSARTLTATITDPHGVPTSGNGLPQLAWKKSLNGSWSYTAGTSIGSGQYTFTFGSGVSTGDTVYYFIVAQDAFSTPAVGVYPFAGAGGFSANPPACSIKPANPSSYYISSGICGTFTVGVGKDYPTLTAAINDFNIKEITCPVVLQLTDATYTSETYPITILNNPGSSATNTLTIKPSSGNTPLMAGISTDCILKFKGAQHIIIDGSNSVANNRNWTIQNNSPGGLSCVTRFSHDGISGASNIVLKNCILQSSLSGILATYGILMDNGVGTGGYTNLTIDNNIINTCRFGAYLGAPVNNQASNIKFTNNTIGSPVDANGTDRHGLEIQNVDNILIQGNEIMGFAGGTSSNQLIGGVLVFSATNAKIIGNKVHDWKPLNAALGASGVGIFYSSDVPTQGEVSNNLVYNITYPGSSSNPIAGGIANGISISSNIGVLKVYNNTVFLSGAYLASTGSTSSACMYIGNNNTQIDFRNNLLKNSSQPVSGSPTAYSFAMAVGTGCSFTSLDYNDYFVDGIGPNIGYIGGTNQITMVSWQTATGMEVNSQNLDPVFAAPTNLMPTSLPLNNKGIYIASNPLDYTGALRTNPSDVGAYEFGTDPFVHTLTNNSITYNSATVHGDANAAGSTVSTYFDYGTTTSYGSSIAATPASVSGLATTPIQLSLSGLGFVTTYHYRARSVAGNGLISYGFDSTFTTLPAPPTVITTAATSVTSAGATLNGSVNPNGGIATVTIQYGLTASYGSTLAASPASVSGLVAVNVSVPVTGLLPYTTYHYRVVAANVSGTINGNDMTFTTLAVPSTVVTLVASNIVGTNATLNGSVNANYAPTNVTFNWGLTTSYGNTATATPSQATGSSVTPVSAGISGLATATTYHFRCVGTGPGGIVYGNDQVFVSDCPTPVLPGAITGSQSVCRNTSGITYSVGAIAGVTGYIWTVPAGATITAGANTNAITVSYSTSATSGNVTVAGVNSCGTGSNSSLAVTVNILPVPVITGPVSKCSGTVGSYSTDAGMTNYLWSVTGGTITAGAGTAAITVTWNTVGAQSVNVNYSNSNGCSAVSPVSYPVNVLPLPVPIISGANVACETSAYLDYTTEPGMTNYVWNMTPNSGTITQSATNVTTIFWTSPGAKWVSVSYTGINGCTSSTPSIYNVTVNPLPGTPGAISGQSAVCAGANGVAYTVAAVTNATSYVWALPAGASIATGAGTNSITVNFNATATSGNITVLAHNNCGDGQSSAVFPVVVNTVPVAPGTITGAATVCQGSAGIAYSVAAVAGATSYAWTVPTGVTIVSGATTNSIIVNFSLTAISGNITVSGVNTCGTGTAATKAIAVNTKPATPVITQNVNILTSSAPTGNQWYRDGILIAGAVATTYTITQDGTYSVIVTLNGCSSDVSNLIVIIHTGLGNFETQDVNVYPNPNKGAFWLSIDSKTAAVYNMQVLNSLGAVVHHENNIEVNGNFKQYFDLRDLSAGMYTIVLRSDKQQIVKKIIVNK